MSLPVVMRFLLLFKGDGFISSGTWHERIPNRIITESLVRRFDHHIIEEDIEGAHVPPGSGWLKDRW